MTKMKCHTDCGQYKFTAYVMVTMVTYQLLILRELYLSMPRTLSYHAKNKIAHKIAHAQI